MTKWSTIAGRATSPTDTYSDAIYGNLSTVLNSEHSDVTLKVTMCHEPTWYCNSIPASRISQHSDKTTQHNKWSSSTREQHEPLADHPGSQVWNQNILLAGQTIYRPETARWGGKLSESRLSAASSPTASPTTSLLHPASKTVVRADVHQ